MQVVVLVVDATDREKLPNARRFLWSVLGNEMLREKPLLVFANKQDLPSALTDNQISCGLGLNELCWTDWHVQVCPSV